MNPQGTSFIPKRPSAGHSPKRTVRKVYVLTYLSYIFFFGTLLTVAGVFFFELTLESQLKQQQQELTNQKSRFSQSDIESIRELSTRIDVANERMEKHISVLSILEALDKNTVQTLQFTSFGYERQGDSSPELSLKGTADTFNSVLFQREVLAENPILAAATFNDVALGSTEEGESESIQVEGMITFELNSEIDAALVKYTPRMNASSSIEILSDEQTAEAGDTTTLETSDGIIDIESSIDMQ